MRFIRFCFFLVTLFLLTNVSFAQDKKIAAGSTAFELKRYDLAYDLYMDLILKDKLDPIKYPEVYRNGAVSCFKVGEYDEAKNLYTQLTTSNKFNFEDAYNFIQLLVYLGDYKEANKIYNNSVVKSSSDVRMNTLEVYFSDTNTRELKKDSLRLKVELVTFNSEKGDFIPVFYPKGVAFTSLRKKHNETPWLLENANLLPAYFFNDSLKKALPLKGVLSKKFKGVSFYDTITKKVYYSKKLSTSKSGSLNPVGVFIYDLKRKKQIPFPYNDKNAFTSHVNVSKDQGILWFASDREGGYGGIDIWYCTKNEKTWGEPVNAGGLINTKGDEMYPFQSNDILFFTSNGHPGLGGFDVYKAMIQDTEVVHVSNVGYPVNTNANDYALIINSKNEEGFIGSNRGDYLDRLFTVKLNDVVVELEAYVYSNIGVNNTVSGVRVLVLDEENHVVDTVYTNAIGKFKFDAKPERNYTFEIGSGDHETLRQAYSTVGYSKSEVIEKKFTIKDKTVAYELSVNDIENADVLDSTQIELKNITTNQDIAFTTDSSGTIKAKLPRDEEYQITVAKLGYDPLVRQINTKDTTVAKVSEKIDVRKTMSGISIRLDNIVYEYNKFDLSPSGQAELDTLISFFKENPEVFLKISSHTDARGPAAYNMELSKKRSESCLNYILDKGIPKSRINVQNCGETKLLNKCRDRVECSEELHKINRRTEFIFTFSKN
jgi:outer membrane protein OmpA-like peptidoglycan-associated protein